MATYTIYSDAADGYISSQSTIYADARSGIGTVTALQSDMRAGQGYNKTGYFVYEGFVSFDTSSVSGAVSSVTLDLYCGLDNSTTDFTVNARAHDWGSTLETADFVAGGSLSGKALRASVSTSGLSTSAYTTFTSDSSFASNTTNPVRLILCSSRTESNTAPPTDSTAELTGWRQSETAGTTQDPKLTVVTADPTPITAVMAPRIPVEAY